jgi:hypothetical protein
MKTFQTLKIELDEVNFKSDQKKLELSRTKIKQTEVFYHSEKKGSKKIRVWVKPKSAKIPEELGVFKDMKTAQKSATQFVKLMGEDVSEGIDFLQRVVEQSRADDILKEINWLGEAKVMAPKAIGDIKKATQGNFHTKAISYLAMQLGDKKSVKKLKAIDDYHKVQGDMPMDLINLRNKIQKDLLNAAKRAYKNYAAVRNAF